MDILVNHMCTRLYMFVRVRICAIIAISVTITQLSCSRTNGQEPDANTIGDSTQASRSTQGSGETLVYSGLFPIDTCYAMTDSEVDYRSADVYVCNHVWTGLLISQVGDYDYSPWRIPTRKEASRLKELTMFDGDSRCVCVDTESGTYYTFTYGGSVTKAGAKTKYSVRPIRVEYTSDSVVVYL